MILAFHGPQYAHLLDRIEPRPVPKPDWPSLVRAAPNAECIVLIVETLVNWPFVENLGTLRREIPDVPFVLVTSGGEANLLELRKFQVEEVVLLGKLDRLPTIVRDARVKALRAAMAESISALPNLDLHLRDLLRALFLAPAPVLTTKAWGKLVELKSSTVLHNFGRCHAAGGPSALVALNLNLLLAAWERAPSSKTWEELAIGVDVGEGRLQRIAHSLLPEWIPSSTSALPRPRVLVRAFLVLVRRVAGKATADL